MQLKTSVLANRKVLVLYNHVSCDGRDCDASCEIRFLSARLQQ